MDLNDIFTPEIHVKDTFRASNGLVLKLKKVSRLILAEAARKVPTPKVPVVFIDDKGRSEENPQDPDYLQALLDQKYEQGMLSVTTMLVLGTEIIDLPAGMEPPESDDWLEILNEIGIEIKVSNKRVRYTAWLKYIALDDESFNALIKDLMRYSGLTIEEDVAKAQEAFRSEDSGPQSVGGSAATESESGDNVRELPKLRTGTRGT